ncbi:PREDICTED: RING finger protein 10 isoform X2 [Nelumbo nucifera]|uniref:RING finger protein 10 isoform X2 n=1 Tax=Nelumbo nucifera TaxID=4432 RepID=A0A1U7Z9J7_NELNU|nr:PREDICTED: RING finger protein 10 isoform X2 [Nelumbo nucifera]
MSISPTYAQSSEAATSRTLSQSPYSDNGLLQAPERIESRAAVPTHSQTLGSMEIPFSDTSSGHFDGISDPMPSAGTGCGGSSKKVNDLRTPDGKKISFHQSHSACPQCRTSNQGGILRCDHVGSAQPNGKVFGAASSPQNPASGSANISSSTTHSAIRKNQMMSANHLLNFHYDPISRPQPRIPPPRRQHKIKPYNKDLFLQANYKFVVLDSGNYALESRDPDKMLEWEDVICVRYFTPLTVRCPICLESPLCPQITSCGHIFCFPCILQYLLMGEEDHKGECWKKCPLCFMMISSRDLYTIYIENVEQYCVGDHVKFALLTRAKDSVVPFQKNQLGKESLPCSSDELCDSFSKFTLTLDVELSTREAKSELDGWLARAESGLVDDLEKLPYVCAALEQLQQRKKCWTEQHACRSDLALRSGRSSCEMPFIGGGFMGEPKLLDSSSPEKLDKKDSLFQTADVSESIEGQERVISSPSEERKFLRKQSTGYEDVTERDSYIFYQAIDGQHLILHPLNMKCLLHYFGSYDQLPPRISGKILQLETVTQSEAMRRRYRFLSHFSLTTTFQLCEIDLTEMLPPDALSPFIEEIKKRENQRKRLAKKERQEKIKAEAAAMNAMSIPSNYPHSSYKDTTFSMDDFEALGNSTIPTSGPTIIGERKLFSDVTRLGFAAGHDSPSLKVESSDGLSNTEAATNASGLTGPRSAATLSFANIISTANSSESLDVPKMNGFGKKGKKPTRVLLSTAGGRRY